MWQTGGLHYLNATVRGNSQFCLQAFCPSGELARLPQSVWLPANIHNTVSIHSNYFIPSCPDMYFCTFCLAQYF